MWENKYSLLNDSLVRDINRFNYIKDDIIESDIGEYEIIFDYENQRYYCYVKAFNSYEALGIFFKEHNSISFNDIVDTVEV